MASSCACRRRGAAKALDALCRSSKATHKVIEKDILAIDLRLPDRVAFRLGAEAAAARAEALAKKRRRREIRHEPALRPRPDAEAEAAGARSARPFCPCSMSAPTRSSASSPSCGRSKGPTCCPGAAIRRRSSASAISAPAGIKAGAIVDMELAELSIRQAVDAAERMAGVRVDVGHRQCLLRPDRQRALFGDGPGRRPPGHATATSTACSMPAPAIRCAIAAPCCIRCRSATSLDGVKRDPRSARHAWPASSASTCMSSRREASPAKNLMLAIERCHLRRRGDGGDALCRRPLRARRRRGRDGRDGHRLGAGTTSGRRLLRPHFVHATASRSAAITSPWTSRAACRPASPRPSGSRSSTARPSPARPTTARRSPCRAVGDDEREDLHQVPRSQAGAHHPPAHRGDPRTGARPAANRPAPGRRPAGASC